MYKSNVRLEKIVRIESDDLDDCMDEILLLYRDLKEVNGIVLSENKQSEYKYKESYNSIDNNSVLVVLEACSNNIANSMKREPYNLHFINKENCALREDSNQTLNIEFLCENYTVEKRITISAPFMSVLIDDLVPSKVRYVKISGLIKTSYIVNIYTDYSITKLPLDIWYRVFLKYNSLVFNYMYPSIKEGVFITNKLKIGISNDKEIKDTKVGKEKDKGKVKSSKNVLKQSDAVNEVANPVDNEVNNKINTKDHPNQQIELLLIVKSSHSKLFKGLVYQPSLISNHNTNTTTSNTLNIHTPLKLSFPPLTHTSQLTVNIMINNPYPLVRSKGEATLYFKALNFQVPNLQVNEIPLIEPFEIICFHEHIKSSILLRDYLHFNPLNNFEATFLVELSDEELISWGVDDHKAKKTDGIIENRIETRKINDSSLSKAQFNVELGDIKLLFYNKVLINITLTPGSPGMLIISYNEFFAIKKCKVKVTVFASEMVFFIEDKQKQINNEKMIEDWEKQEQGRKGKGGLSRSAFIIEENNVTLGSGLVAANNISSLYNQRQRKKFINVDPEDKKKKDIKDVKDNKDKGKKKDIKEIPPPQIEEPIYMKININKPVAIKHTLNNQITKFEQDSRDNKIFFNSSLISVDDSKKLVKKLNENNSLLNNTFKLLIKPKYNLNPYQTDFKCISSNINSVNSSFHQSFNPENSNINNHSSIHNNQIPTLINKSKFNLNSINKIDPIHHNNNQIKQNPTPLLPDLFPELYPNHNLLSDHIHLNLDQATQLKHMKNPDPSHPSNKNPLIILNNDIADIRDDKSLLRSTIINKSTTYQIDLNGVFITKPITDTRKKLLTHVSSHKIFRNTFVKQRTYIKDKSFVDNQTESIIETLKRYKTLDWEKISSIISNAILLKIKLPESLLIEVTNHRISEILPIVKKDKKQLAKAITEMQNLQLDTIQLTSLIK